MSASDYVYRSSFPTSSTFVDLLTIASSAPFAVVEDPGPPERLAGIYARGAALRMLGTELVNRLRVGSPRMDFEGRAGAHDERAWSDSKRPTQTMDSDATTPADFDPDPAYLAAATWYAKTSPSPWLMRGGRVLTDAELVTRAEYSAIVAEIVSEAAALQATVAGLMGEPAWAAARAAWE